MLRIYSEYLFVEIITGLAATFHVILILVFIHDFLVNAEVYSANYENKGE